MKISELKNHIMEDSKVELAKREASFKMACSLAEFFERKVSSMASFDFSPEKLHRLALQESRKTELKITQAFGLGLLSIPIPKIGTDAERSALYREIIEYLQLVQIGLDSFVEAHPIKAIEEGGAENV